MTPLLIPISTLVEPEDMLSSFNHKENLQRIRETQIPHNTREEKLP
jgi:hypothetical protein